MPHFIISCIPLIYLSNIPSSCAYFAYEGNWSCIMINRNCYAIQLETKRIYSCPVISGFTLCWRLLASSSLVLNSVIWWRNNIISSPVGTYLVQLNVLFFFGLGNGMLLHVFFVSFNYAKEDNHRHGRLHGYSRHKTITFASVCPLIEPSVISINHKPVKLKYVIPSQEYILW